MGAIRKYVTTNTTKKRSIILSFFFIIIRKTPIFNSLRTLDEFKSGILMRIRDDWCKSSKI